MSLLNIQENCPTDFKLYDKEYNFGYSTYFLPIYIILCVSIILNILNIFFNINIKQKINNDFISNYVLEILTYLDIFAFIKKIYWLIQIVIFSNLKYFINYCFFCYYLSNIYISLLIFYFCILLSFLQILNNISNISKLKLYSKFKKYFFISIAYSILLLIIINLGELIGISPMLTCFISNKNNKNYISLIITVILLSILFGNIFYLIYKIFTNKNKINGNIKTTYITVIFNLIIIIIFNLPTLFLYIFSFGVKNLENEKFKLLSIISILGNFTSNIIIETEKFLRNYFSIYLLKYLYDNPEYNENLNENLIIFHDDHKYKEINELDYKEKRDLIFGIGLTLFKYRLQEPENKDLMSKDINKINVSNFNSRDNELYSELNILERINKSPLNLIVNQFAPNIFKKIRMYDEVFDEELINSILKSFCEETGYKNENENENLLVTNDELFTLKVINKENFDLLMSNSFLNYYLNHLENHPNSLICRLYGIFSIKFVNSNSIILIIIMKNILKPFLDNEKIISKFVTIKNSDINKLVEKSNEDYLKEIGIINMNLRDKENFLKIIKSDVLFLEDKNIKDYSLKIIKIVYNKVNKNSFQIKKYENNLFISNERDNENNDNYFGYIFMIIDYFKQCSFDENLSMTPLKYCESFMNYCQIIS